MRRRLIVTCLILTGLAAAVAAREIRGGGQHGPVFRSGAELVALNVTVMDAQQRFVRGLRAEDFAVFEDGVRQKVSFFADADVPLDLILLLDTSASMSHKMPTLRAAARGFIETLRPGDRGAIVSFADSIHVRQALTGDLGLLTRAIDSTRARGATALYNALYVTLREFGRAATQAGEVRRQAIVMYSDGDDTSSLISFDEVLDEAKRAAVSLYAVALRTPSSRDEERGRYSEARYAMQALARETGAQAFFPQTIEDLAGIYGQIASELNNQYAIGYTPTNTRADGRFRRVVVQVIDRPDLRLRARTGYFAERAVASAAAPPVATAERQ